MEYSEIYKGRTTMDKEVEAILEHIENNTSVRDNELYLKAL